MRSVEFEALTESGVGRESQVMEAGLMERMTQASLFCGAGGIDIGFERAGFKTV